MSGDSFSLNLPLARFATDSCEATALYRELRKPCFDIWPVSGSRARKHRMSYKILFLACISTCPRAGRRKTFAAGCFASPITAPGIVQKSYARRLGGPLDPGFDLISHAATPEQTVLAKEKFHRLDKAIRSLAAPERECLMLRAEGLRYREIGEVLGIPTSTVGDTVERAVKKLAEKCNV